MIQNTNKHVENSCHNWNNENKAHARLSNLSDCLFVWGAEHRPFLDFLLSLCMEATWLWPKKQKNKTKKKTTITTAVPLKTPCVWGMLRNLSWGRLERNASISWDWTQRRKTKITHVKVSTSKIKSSYSVNRVSDAEMDSHFMRAWHPEQGSFIWMSRKLVDVAVAMHMSSNNWWEEAQNTLSSVVYESIPQQLPNT